MNSIATGITTATSTPSSQHFSGTSSGTEDGPDGIIIGPIENIEARRTTNCQAGCWLRLVLFLFVAGVLVFIVVDSFTGKQVEAISLDFLAWVQRNPGLGVLAVVVVYALATLLFVPGSILTIGAGFAFGTALKSTEIGVLLASLAVFVGAFIGSTASFLLGRYLFRDVVVRLAARYAVFRAVDKAMQGNGLKIMILLRLSPLIPYNALDYMSGITSISLLAYCLGLFAIIPGVIMFTFVGASASSLVDSSEEASRNETAKIFTLVFGVTFAIIGVLVASYYSKIELDKILEENEDGTTLTSRSPLNLQQEGNEQPGVLGDHGTV